MTNHSFHIKASGVTRAAVYCPSLRILLEHPAKWGNGVWKEDGRPSAAAAADVRAPLEAVELQTVARSEELRLMLAAERRQRAGAGWAWHASQVCTDTTNTQSMSAAGAGRRSEGLNTGDWAHSCGFSGFLNFSVFPPAFHGERRPTRPPELPAPASPCFSPAGVRCSRQEEGRRKSRCLINYLTKRLCAEQRDAVPEWPQTGRDARERTLCQRRPGEKVRGHCTQSRANR